MLGDISGVGKIYLVCGYTDMRKSINGLMAIVRDAYHMDPYSNSLFLFCGRRCDRLKALHFERDGFVLLQGPGAGRRKVQLAQERSGSKNAYPTGIQVADGRSFRGAATCDLTASQAGK